jgi:hypothetical protein
MRINVAVPEAQVTKPVLDSALESVTRLDEQLIASGSVLPFRNALRRDKIRWKPEEPGDEHFDHAGIVQRRKWGDCDDLAPWHAASLRASGEDPDAVAVVRRSGPTRWHAYVERSDGTTDDPSREAGMGKKPEGVVGAVLPVMFNPTELQGVGDDLGEYIVRPSIALRPAPRNAWQARVDLPWHEQEQRIHLPTDYAMTTLHGHAHAAQALVGALEGAAKLGLAGGYAHPDHIARIGAICDTIDGVAYEDIAACYGEAHAQAADQFVGSFLSKAWKGVKKGAKAVAKGAKAIAPLASRVLKFVPGVGPLASEAIDFARKINPGASPQVVKAFAASFGQGGFRVV